MKIINTDYDEYGWKTRMYLRDKNKVLIIQRKSNLKPENNHGVYLDENTTLLLKRLLREVRK